MRLLFFYFLSTIFFTSLYANIDLKRYAGVWHEIARLPNSCETNCIRNISEYTLLNNGSFQILSRCVKGNGYIRESTGVAQFKNPATNSNFKINFTPPWLRWTGLGWEDYSIIHLDKQYQIVVIADPYQDFLWILSRSESIEENTYNALLAKLQSKNFDLSHLIISGKIISKSKLS